MVSSVRPCTYYPLLLPLYAQLYSLITFTLRQRFGIVRHTYDYSILTYVYSLLHFFRTPVCSVVSASNNARYTPLPVHLRHNSPAHPIKVRIALLTRTL